MRFQDYKLNSQLRAIFVQRWVDLSCLDYGVTNGVVYLRGTLRHHLTSSSVGLDDEERIKDEAADLARNLERVIKQMYGVRDVIFQLRNLKKRGSKWVHQ